VIGPDNVLRIAILIVCQHQSPLELASFDFVTKVQEMKAGGQGSLKNATVNATPSLVTPRRKLSHVVQVTLNVEPIDSCDATTEALFKCSLL